MTNQKKNGEAFSAYAGAYFRFPENLKGTEYKTEEQYEQVGNERKVSVSGAD